LNVGLSTIQQDRDRGKFWKTNRQTLNPKPALGLHFKISFDRVKKLDNEGEFEVFLKTNCVKLSRSLIVYQNNL